MPELERGVPVVPDKVKVTEPPLKVPLVIVNTSDTVVASWRVHPPPEPLKVRS